MKLLRPPYGAHNGTVDEVVKRLGYRLAFWNVDSLDWQKNYREGGWVSHAMQQIEVGKHCIVLAHDIHATTVSNFPQLVAAIKQLPDTQFVQLV
jgi:peptidoglycan/xylan/chitin deacetylase (PgdA/CDA1 family)